MPKRVIQSLEQAYGDLHKIIPPIVNQHGQSFAARELNVSQSTISDWLRLNNYERRILYVKRTDKGGKSNKKAGTQR